MKDETFALFAPEAVRLCSVAWEAMERVKSAPTAVHRLENGHLAQEAILRVKEMVERFLPDSTHEESN